MKVNFFAPMNTLGYGIHSYNTIRAFEDLGHHATLIPPFGQVHKSDKYIEEWLSRREHFDVNAPGVMIFNEDFLTQFTGRPRIGFPVFECEKFTALQLACIKSCDYILTPSKWGAQVLKDNGVLNVKIVNEGFDPEIFQWVETSDAEEAGEPFTFVHVGKFEERKGTLQVIQCFFNALENENAQLLMHIHNPFIQSYQKIHELLSSLGFITTNIITNKGVTWRRMGLSIHFSDPFENNSVLAGLYRKADCGLYPSRAEGWGLPILETLATGVPCIVGNWSGQSEYLNEMGDFACFRLMSKKVPASDGMWFRGDRGNWIVPDNAALESEIKRMFQEGREFRKSGSWKEAVKRVRQFTWARAGQQLESALKEICGL